MLRIYLMGEVQVENDGRLLRESELGGPQGRFVLAHLVTERKRAVTQSELAEAVWPESLPASWTLALSAIVSRLRSRLAGVGLPRSHIIGNAFGCYQFTPPGETWVDVEAALAGVDAAEGALVAAIPRRPMAPRSSRPPSCDVRFCRATTEHGSTTGARLWRRAWSGHSTAGSTR